MEVSCFFIIKNNFNEVNFNAERCSKESRPIGIAI